MDTYGGLCAALPPQAWGEVMDNEYAVWTPPKNAGCYVIGGSVQIYMQVRPNWLARTMCRWLLQWEWRDAK